jgi:indole-3-glycerol phosphate synthase
MLDFLARMAASSRDRLRAARARVGPSELIRRALERPQPKALQQDPSGFDVLAEIKPRSPSFGTLLSARTLDAPALGAGYAQGGACAVSVLTEPTEFGGSLTTLSEVAEGCPIPAMRKDFLVDPYQVIEARAHGASGVLLIARLLDDVLLAEMLDAAASMKMFVLLEAFHAGDLERAVGFLARSRAAGLLGVNARDLATLSIDPTRHAALARSSPPGLRLVAESGIATPEDAARLARLGYSAVLVGGALMRAADPVPLLRTMIASGRCAALLREVTR